MTGTPRNTCVVAAVAMAVGLVASACNGSSGSATQATATAAAPSGARLQSLLPTPESSQQTQGPDGIADHGLHMRYQVNGSPGTVMDAYKAALEVKGWEVTTIVTSGSGGGGGGATYTGTNGDAYGVFDGGGFKTTTYVNVCTWPTKPENPNCSRGDQ
jgi:hypothetical protein